MYDDTSPVASDGYNCWNDVVATMILMTVLVKMGGRIMIRGI